VVKVYIIVVYDVAAERCAKIMKILRKYLFHLQESVFEGNITQKELNDLKKELQFKINPEYDSIIIYEMLSDKYLYKHYEGVKKNHNTIII